MTELETLMVIGLMHLIGVLIISCILHYLGSTRRKNE